MSALIPDLPKGLLIGGKWLETARRSPVEDPATGAQLAEVSHAGPAEARAALDAACVVQDEWASVPPRVRANLFHKAHRLLCDREADFAALITAEAGKPQAEALGEVRLSLDFFLWYAEQIAHLHGSYATGSHGGFRIITTHRPVGPCLLITPWNFPLLMIARKAGAALAAGCTTIVKSAAETPLTATLFVEVLQDAGFPAGVVNLLHTAQSAPISETLMADERLRKISFTGSTGVGSTLLAQAAPRITNTSMELGGDGPFIVLDDADLGLAVTQAIACKFRNAGQACVAANRIILHRAIADRFTQAFVAATQALRVGPGSDPTSDVGPMISARQRDRVAELLSDLRQAGATVLTGGNIINGPGYFFQPTVLTSPDLVCLGESCELFGPLAVLYTVDDVDEAIRFANRSSFGLAGYIFTRDINRAIALSERLEVGMVGINRGIMADPAAPFGGIKASGLGREGGHGGIYEFMEERYLALTVDASLAGEG